MARTGRPKIEIDKKQFENLCGLQCTELEICDWFECSEDTINRWCKKTYRDDKGNPMTFAEVYEQKRQKGRSSLRRMQWKLAEKNAAMAIFLGKQFLGQKDQPEIVVGAGSLADAIQTAYEFHKSESDDNEGDDAR